MVLNEKRKLTLSINKNVIEKAQKLNVNLSKITEKMLDNLPEINISEAPSHEEVIAAYKEIYSALRPILKDYGASAKIGEIFFKDEVWPVYLDHDGTIGFFNDLVGEYDTQTVDQLFANSSFFPASAENLLSNLVDGLVKATEKNKENLKQLNEFKTVLDVLKPMLARNPNDSRKSPTETKK